MPANDKIIAIWGSPHSGKTTFSVKFAESLYEKTRATVLVLFTDRLTPTLPVLFPNYRTQDLYSVGTVLSKTNLFRNDILSGIVTLKERQNLGFMGYRNGENKYSFPDFDAEKANEFYTVLSDIADYIIVDCVSDTETNPLSDIGMKEAGMLIRTATPDLSSLSFFQSQTPTMTGGGCFAEKQLSILNILSSDTVPLVPDYASHLDTQIVLPYSAELHEQYLSGTLFSPMKDKKYDNAVRTVTEAIRR